MQAAAVSDMAALLGSRRWLTSAESTEAYRRDRAETLDAGHPLGVAFPTSTDDVAGIVAIAARDGIPVVPRGAGSGLAGGANAVEGCIVLCTSRMDEIRQISRDDLIAVVQPGVVNADLQRALEPHGLRYAPDPASFEISTIGGNIATNAGGLRCFRHGATRESVLALEVVLADASVMRVGHASIKGVAGLDLVSLFVGSEGVLGIITEATLRVRGRGGPLVTALGFFETLDGAARAIERLRSGGDSLELLEIMDAATLQAVEEWKGSGVATGTRAAVLAQAGGSSADELAAALNDAGASEAFSSTDHLESSAMLDLRRSAFPALERLGVAVLEDVAVPLGSMTELMARVEDVARIERLTIGTFGHAGDGNLHPTLVVPRGDHEALLRVQAAGDRILEATLDLGGTITGEHGIGILKREMLARELDPRASELTRTIKQMLDPLGILNPGKAA